MACSNAPRATVMKSGSLLGLLGMIPLRHGEAKIVHFFNLKGREKAQEVIGSALADDGSIVTVNNEKGDVVAKFTWSELQGYSEGGDA
jgi:hypothetical protein